MYSDHQKKKPGKKLAALAALIVVIAGVCVLVFGGSGKDLGDQSAAAIEDTVRRQALQCYVVEGVYPPSLDYLEENYGLEINTDDFYVTYDAFASNLPPTVKVLSKNG